MAIYRASFVMQFSLQLPNCLTREGAEHRARQFADLGPAELLRHVGDQCGGVSCVVATVDLDPTSTLAYRKAAQVTTLLNRKLKDGPGYGNDGRPEISQAEVTEVLRCAELLPS